VPCACLERARAALQRLPHPNRTLPAVDALDELLGSLPAAGDDGKQLDAAMDDLQVALGRLNDAVYDTFVRAAE